MQNPNFRLIIPMAVICYSNPIFIFNFNSKRNIYKMLLKNMLIRVDSFYGSYTL